MTTITVTDAERYATAWALVEDIARMAKGLLEECETFTNARPGGEEYGCAADVAGIARQIGHAAAPLLALAEPTTEPGEA